MKYQHRGTLRHNDQGRYSLQDGYYFTSGDSIQIFYDEMWLQGRVEYSHELQDYYFLKESEGIYVNSLQGLKARI